MVTTDEIVEVPLFAGLSAGGRERLSRTSADISLAAGEYAVHEGDERALFVVLDGRIEVVKLVDGIERVLGERLPGSIFGEVPITLGTPFPSGFRAAAASRVMRIEAQDYHAVASAAPELAVDVGALARKRTAGRRSGRRAGAAACAGGGTAGTRTARSCAASATATRSRSNRSRRTTRTPPSAGRAHPRYVAMGMY